MGVLSGLGWLALLALLTALFYVLLGDEAAMIRERIGIDRRNGGIAYVAWGVGSAVPFFLGARVEGTIGCPLSLAVFTVGVVGVAVAATNREAYAAVRSASDRPIGAVRPGDEAPVTAGGRLTEVAATSFGTWDADSEGRPFPVTPFDGVEVVAVDWTYQEYRRVGTRRNWTNEAWGSLSTPFRLESESGTVVVDPRDARLVGENAVTQFDADDPLPERTASFLEHHESLPDPADRTHRARIQEEFVPANQGVTVVGYPSEGLGEATGETDAVDPTFAAGSVALRGGEASTLLVVSENFEEAVARLRRRVLWAGVGGVVAIVAGQGLALALTRATLPVA